jgi:DNA topoisomerase III
VDFTGQEPVGKCPKCGSNVFEHGMNYVCEKAVGDKRVCDFRTGKIILQQPIERDQAKKLLETGKTDLLTKFVSKRNNRTFKAFLKLGQGGKVEFEFEPRAAKEGKKAKSDEPKVKLDFTGQEPMGKCPKCGGSVFESETDYLCERSQNDTRRCTFKIGKTILQQPIPREQAVKILRDSKSDVMNGFISKAGKPFPAWLVLDDKGKVTFEFPPRDSDAGG